MGYWWGGGWGLEPGWSWGVENALGRGVQGQELPVEQGYGLEEWADEIGFKKGRWDGDQMARANLGIGSAG